MYECENRKCMPQKCAVCGLFVSRYKLLPGNVAICLDCLGEDRKKEEPKKGKRVFNIEPL